MSQETEEIIALDLQKIKSLIPQYSSEKLCEMVVCHRYFGFNPEMAIMCMEELAIRRAGGNDFQFEDYISTSLASLPVLNFNIHDLRATLGSLVKKK